jgi:hypothetical protein
VTAASTYNGGSFRKEPGHETPVARTIEATCQHYGWTRTFVYDQLAMQKLEARKAGRRTLVTTESAERLFRNLPRAQFTAPKAAA